MKRFLFLYVCVFMLLSVFASCSTTDEVSLVQKSQPITFGKVSGKYPAVGLFGTEKGLYGPFCSAVLVAPNLILTGGHCVEAISDLLGARYKELYFHYDVPNADGKIRYRTKVKASQGRSWTHPDYKKVTYFNDVAGEHDHAIVELAAPITEISPVPLFQGKVDSSWHGKKVLLVGYGFGETHNQSKKRWETIRGEKRYEKFTVLKTDFHPKYQSPFPGALHYGVKRGSTMPGDSGSPTLYPVNGLMTFISVHSHASIFGHGIGPSTGYHVSKYYPWLKTTIEKYASCKQRQACKDKFCKDGTCNFLGKTAYHPPSVCEKDEDCGKDAVCHTFGKKSLCLESCETSKICPQGYFCTTRTSSNHHHYCVPEHLGQPDAQVCSKDTDCGDGEACFQGACAIKSLPTLAKKACHPCKSHKDCGDGGFCDISSGNAGVCLQACGKGDLCPDGFACMELYPGVDKCIPLVRSCDAKCSQDKDCWSGATCSNGRCKRKNGALENEACSENTPCKSGLSCVVGVYVNRCLKPCANSNDCLDGQRCQHGKRIEGTTSDFCTGLGIQTTLGYCNATRACRENYVCLKQYDTSRHTFPDGSSRYSSSNPLSRCFQSCSKDGDCKSRPNGRCVRGKGEMVCNYSELSSSYLASVYVQKCYSPEDCPNKYNCVKNACVFWGDKEIVREQTTPSQENAENQDSKEKVAENLAGEVSDAGLETGSPDVSKQEQSTSQEGQATTLRDEDKESDEQSGCQCSSSSTKIPMLPMLSVLFLLLFWYSQRKRLNCDK